MNKFLFLFRNNPEVYKAMSPEQMQQQMKKWVAWKDDLEGRGHVLAFGERLDHGGRVIRGKAKDVTDGPFVEVKDFIQGHIFVQAKDLDQATELAKHCPVLEANGSVEIRALVAP